MPVVFREGGLRFYFFSNEGSPREPAHIHVRGGGREAKIWLEPNVAIGESFGFTSADLTHILDVVAKNRAKLMDAWHGHFGD